MSTRAKGADGPIDRRVSVGMTAAEAEALGVAAERAGLGLARFLVAAAMSRVRHGVPTKLNVEMHYTVEGPAGVVRVLDTLLIRGGPSHLGELKPEGAKRYIAQRNRLRGLRVGDVVVTRCENHRFRVIVVGPSRIETIGWFRGVARADAVVNRLLRDRGHLPAVEAEAR